MYSALLIGAAVYGRSCWARVDHAEPVRRGDGWHRATHHRRCVIVAMDTFGPVSDNAPGHRGDVRRRGGRGGAAVLTSPDAVGNSTKAITKGITIATAVLAATAVRVPSAMR